MKEALKMMEKLVESKDLEIAHLKNELENFKDAYVERNNEVNRLKKDKEELEAIAAMFDKEVYQYIQWETSNTETKPNFQGCHDAMDRYNDYIKSKNTSNE